MYAIETHELRKTFQTRQGKEKTIEAVKGIDLQVQEGAFFGFLGPNGAGKTTTLRMLTTLIPPTDGDASIVGHDLLKAPVRVRACVGYVSQVGGTDPACTGRENLHLQARLYGLSSHDARKRTDELLSALELEPFADRIVKTYSGGLKRRLDLALGMVHSPRLLFLDEPTTGLDPQSRARLWDELRKLQSRGTTLFLTTHYLEEADTLADTLAIIDYGEIVAQGTPDSLKRQIAGDVVTLGFDLHNGELDQASTLLNQQPFVREVHTLQGELQLYVEDGEGSLPQIFRLLDHAGLSVHTAALARPTLDDVFLRKTGRSLRDTDD